MPQLLLAHHTLKEVWSRSLCRSLEKMVAVEQEYPGGVEHIFSPGCVPLQRCSGCCNDEKLECFPTFTHNITMQLVKISPSQRTRQYVELSFLEHHSCECRPKRNHNRNLREKLSSPHRRRKGKQGKKRTANCGKNIMEKSSDILPRKKKSNYGKCLDCPVSPQHRVYKRCVLIISANRRISSPSLFPP
ncbi:vascular endothelial growth factor A isoform X3 [Pygocentrus nattereri]|uniref:vascular endothelial growth factor A isoform X3 n=1 Tax=Pygocentrus nattereri TaxID=42514 RepID=UPI0008143385|nr:vascular endothelial growth factor A isoform X3 [Pygocentrus nattereri]